MSVAVDKEQLSAVEKAQIYLAERKNNLKYKLNTDTSKLTYHNQRQLYIDTLHSGNEGYIFLPRKKYWKNPEDQYYIDENGKKKKKAGMQHNVTFKLGSGNPDALIWASTNDSYVSANPFDGICSEKGMMLRTEQHCVGINELHFDIDILHGDFEEYPCELADQVMEVLIPELLNFLPEPTMIVSSGRGLTWIYRYDKLIEDPSIEEMVGKRKTVIHENEQVLRHDAAYRRIVEKLHAVYDPEVIDFDTTITDHSRICRIPGTINRKAGRYATLISCNPELRYNPDELYRLLGVSSEPILSDKKIERKKNTKKKPASGQVVSDTQKGQREKAIPANAIPFTPVEYRTAAKARIPKMEKIPDEITLIDGSGRHRFIFVYYCHCRLLYLQPVAADMARALNSRFTEPLSDVELENQIERIDVHYETDYNMHGDGCYIFKTETFETFLPIGKEKAREMGFLRSKELREKCKKNQAEAEDRDREIAELWLDGCTAQEISEELQEKYKCVSLATIKRVLKRLGLNRERWQSMCEVDFEGNGRYARKQKTDNTSIQSPAKIVNFEEEKNHIKENDESINFSKIKYERRVCDDARYGNEEQQLAYERLLSGKNCYMMGVAGSGKSTLIRRFVEVKESEGCKVLVMAPSGSAAANIGGMTIHRALGIPVKETYMNIPVGDMADLWCLFDVDVVVIDEIGMVRVDEFDYILNMIMAAEEMWCKHIQVICVGDFCQLAPVMRNRAVGVNDDFVRWDSLYAFSSSVAKQVKMWSDPIILRHVWRQSDQEFCAALQAVAAGDVAGAMYINDHVQVGIGQDKLVESLETGSVYLAAHRSKVNAVNRMMLLRHKDDLSYREWKSDGLQNGVSDLFPVPDVVTTYEGMPVVFVQNEDRFCNGMRGTIKKVYESYVLVEADGRNMKIYPRDIYANDGSERTVRQLPIVPAYGMTIHKAQGLTLDNVILDPGCFEIGQLYTALSRVRTIQDIVLTRKIRKSDLMVSHDVQMFLRNIG